MSTKGIGLQILVIVSAIGLFVGIVNAPKNLSKKKIQEQKTVETRNEMAGQITEVKNSMKKDELDLINSFEAKFESTSGNEKIQWLDSIINFWDQSMRPAISAVYAKDKAGLTNKTEDYLEAGERFIGVGQFLKQEDKPWAYAEARAIFEGILQKDPENTDAKINLAICMVETSPDNPMAGITMLREVVEKEPNNTRAILQLGHFSVLSGQYSKAIERYQQALKIDPELSEAYFFLGDTYAKMGDMVNGEKYLLMYRGRLDNEEVKQQLDIYLEDLKKMSNTKIN